MSKQYYGISWKFWVIGFIFSSLAHIFDNTFVNSLYLLVLGAGLVLILTGKFDALTKREAQVGALCATAYIGIYLPIVYYNIWATLVLVAIAGAYFSWYAGKWGFRDLFHDYSQHPPVKVGDKVLTTYGEEFIITDMPEGQGVVRGERLPSGTHLWFPTNQVSRLL